MSVQMEAFRRHCNCLTNESKDVRDRAIKAIEQEIAKIQPDEDVLSELMSSVLVVFSDPAEKCRKRGISVAVQMIAKSSDTQAFLKFIIPVLKQRLGQQHITEPSEEIRLDLMKLLHQLVRLSGKRIAPYLDDLIAILQKTIIERFPDMVIESCSFASDLAKAIPEHFHMQSESLIHPLLENLSHNQFKVRVAIIKSIGDVIQYGNGKSVDDVVSPLAQKLFDDKSAVRLAVTQVVGYWLLDLPDRYSFHHKLIPLLLTSITDEYPDIRREADTLWQDIGEKYAAENEKDLKDKLDFVKPDYNNYPLNTERPNFGCRMLVYHHFSKILSGIVGDLGDSFSSAVRIKSSHLLCTLLINEEDNVTQHLEKVLTGLKRACNDEEKEVRFNVLKSARLLGFFVPPEVWCKMVLPNVKLLINSGELPLYGFLSVLAAFIDGSNKEHLRSYWTDISKVIGDPGINHIANTNLHICLLDVVRAVITIAGEDCQQISWTIFDILLSVIALHRQDEVKERAEDLLVKLAKAENLTDKNELFQTHVKQTLDSMESSYESWTEHSVERLVFGTLLIEAGPVIVIVLDDVMKILLVNLKPSKHADLRCHFFGLLSHLVTFADESQNSESRFGDFVEIIIKDMILPNCVWTAGRTAEVLRKTAITCLWVILSKEGLVTMKQLVSVMDDVVKQLRSLLTDDNFGTRLLTCQVLSRLFFLVGDRLHADQALYNMYPDLLERLNDGSDEVRVAAAKTFATYFGCLCKQYDVSMYRAHLEAIFRGLLLHMDDCNQQIQKTMLDTLKCGATVQPDMLLKEIAAARHRLRCTDSCDELVQFINSLPKPE